MTRIRLVLTAALAALAGSFAVAEELTLVSWGGAYARATEQAVLEPFSAETGILIRRDDYNGGLAEIRAQVETGNVHWDVVDLESAGRRARLRRRSARGGHGGWRYSPDRTRRAAARDFLPGTLSECGVGVHFFPPPYTRTVPITSRTRSRRPWPTSSTWTGFPARRGMRRTAHGNVEFALVADGVPV